MDLNQMNNPDNNIDESSSGQKLFNELNYDCLVKVLMYIPVLERLEMEKGNSSFIYFLLSVYCTWNKFQQNTHIFLW